MMYLMGLRMFFFLRHIIFPHILDHSGVSSLLAFMSHSHFILKYRKNVLVLCEVGLHVGQQACDVDAKL